MNMKKHFLILILFLAVFKLSAQDFAPVGAKWYYNEMFAFSGDIDYIKYTSEKDTLIHGKICRKIIKRHDLFCNGRPEAEFLFSRNDTVFFLDTLFNEFQILYDFNAQAKNSWIIKIKDVTQDVDTICVTVDSVSIKQINGLDLKVMSVTYHKFDELTPEIYSSVIIDKIGDIQFMFNWYPWSGKICDGNYTNGLRCYQDDVIGLYSTGIVDSCDYQYKWVSVDKISKKKIYELFPNPTNSQFQLKVDSKKKCSVEISNLNGVVVYSSDFISSTSIDLTGSPKGMYIFQLKSEGGIVGVGRLILE
jgi:hypothetical protein